MKQRLLKTICLLLLPVLLLTGCWQEEPLPGDGDLLQANQQETEPADSRLILPELFSGRGPGIPLMVLSISTSDASFRNAFTKLFLEGKIGEESTNTTITSPVVKPRRTNTWRSNP